MRITQATRTSWSMVILSNIVKIGVTSFVIYTMLSAYYWYTYGYNPTVEDNSVQEIIQNWRDVLINASVVAGILLPGLFLHQEIIRLLIGLKNGEILKIYQHKITVIDERVNDAEEEIDIELEEEDFTNNI